MIFVGTSGYNYPEWKGGFYPANLPMSKMLPYYAEHFSTVEINYSFVEINYSFYRMPSEKALEGWSGATPEGFAFTLKAPRRITHEARLRDCDDLLQTFGKRARTLGPKLGTLLFQLPPSFRKDLEALNVLLDWVPPDIRVAMEFRHDSWHSDDVFQRLKDTNVALCIADNEKGTTPAGGHRGPRIFPPAGRRLPGGRHRPVGGHHPGARDSLGGHLRLLQARRRG